MKLARSSGILLHITSLPGPFGIGDLGPSAYHFADFLENTHQTVWQILPVVPAGLGNSPYASPSTFAGNPLLISPELLKDEGFLTNEDLNQGPSFDSSLVDFDQVTAFKYKLLEKAYHRFSEQADKKQQDAFDAFCSQEAHWLEDYALFAVLKYVYQGAEWTHWDEPLRTRRPNAIKKAHRTYANEIRMQQFWQFVFYHQWKNLKAYCNAKGILIFGDIPIYVAHDSCDVWSNPHLFHLDEELSQKVVAGVPPDYFSETGQRWGNPIYRWDLMRENDYSWWTKRFESALGLLDLVRLDHFRGFEAYWAVPSTEPTAINGEWVQGPGAHFFEVIERKLGNLPVIAENLGFITEEVTALMNQFGYPGMAILQFAFDSDSAAGFLPHNYQENIIAYTGTHDNDTILGWWKNNNSTQDERLVARARKYAADYLGIDPQDEHSIIWSFNQALMASVARLAIFPLQDLIGSGSETRMNTPGTLQPQNWAWRFTWDQIPESMPARLKHITNVYGRGPAPYLPE